MALTIEALRRVLGDEAALDSLPLRIAGPGGAYRVVALRVWDDALWFEIDRDPAWRPPALRRRSRRLDKPAPA